jgi:hypothetical protein
MKAAILAGLLVAVPAAAWAEDAPAIPPKSVCVDANLGYHARSLNQHDVYIENAVGKRRSARLKTSCINLEPSVAIAVHSSFICIGMGDDVSASTIDGHREQCVVTRVLPYVPEEGDKKS